MRIPADDCSYHSVCACCARGFLIFFFNFISSCDIFIIEAMADQDILDL